MIDTITILLYAFSGASGAVMWCLKFRLVISIFKPIEESINRHYGVFSKKYQKWQEGGLVNPFNPFWWVPYYSWRNKYKGGESFYGPAFFGSTTFLVWLTDAFHFFQMLMLTSIELAISLNWGFVFFDFQSWALQILAGVVILKLARGALFNFMFHFLLRSKEMKKQAIEKLWSSFRAWFSFGPFWVSLLVALAGLAILVGLDRVWPVTGEIVVSVILLTAILLAFGLWLRDVFSKPKIMPQKYGFELIETHETSGGFSEASYKLGDYKLVYDTEEKKYHLWHINTEGYLYVGGPTWDLVKRLREIQKTEII